MAERFFHDGPLAVGPVTLQGPEAHHLAAVTRHRPGDVVRLFNGDGREYVAEVVAVDRRRAALEVTAVEAPVRELGYPLEVAAPLPKGDRGEWLLEKLTELGVTGFTPLATRRSVVHPGGGKQEKLRRVVVEASKQCGRNVLLELRPLAAWADLCRRPDLPQTRLLAHPTPAAGAARLAPPPSPLAGEGRGGGEKKDSGVIVAVGPEGGFSDDEVSEATAAGWRVVGLGPRVLRIETAAVALAVQFGLGGA
jgi:16S rRNA (uracil1498-N3)-methyltransferase